MILKVIYRKTELFSMTYVKHQRNVSHSKKLFAVTLAKGKPLLLYVPSLRKLNSLAITNIKGKISNFDFLYGL